MAGSGGAKKTARKGAKKAATVIAKKTNGYIVELSGGGDTFVAIVDKDTWDWIQDGGIPPESLVKRYARDEEITVAEAQEQLGQMDDDNDRAMAIPTGKYSSGAEAQRAADKKGIKIKGEYQGYWY